MSKDFIKVIISQIEEMEDHQKDSSKKVWDMIDRQKETIASYLEQNKVEDDWAKKFLKKMEIGL